MEIFKSTTRQKAIAVLWNDFYEAHWAEINDTPQGVSAAYWSRLFAEYVLENTDKLKRVEDFERWREHPEKCPTCGGDTQQLSEDKWRCTPCGSEVYINSKLMSRLKSQEGR